MSDNKFTRYNIQITPDVLSYISHSTVVLDLNYNILLASL